MDIEAGVMRQTVPGQKSGVGVGRALRFLSNDMSNTFLMMYKPLVSAHRVSLRTRRAGERGKLFASDPILAVNY